MQLDSLRQEQRSIYELVYSVGNYFGRPFTQADLVARVASLSPEQLAVAERSLSQFVGIVEKAIDREIGITNTCDFFLFWLSEMNMRAPFDVREYIKDGDIVEVYDLDFVQISRNHTFYEFCSYDPLTLATTPFHDLFKRDDSINSIIFEHAKRCLGPGGGAHKMETPVHTMQENFARNSKVFEITHGWCGPLVKEGGDEVIAFFTTQQAKYIGDSNVTGMGQFFTH